LAALIVRQIELLPPSRDGEPKEAQASTDREV
jgi:hypothetical protein